jgi:hypothetical protein
MLNPGPRFDEDVADEGMLGAARGFSGSRGARAGRELTQRLSSGVAGRSVFEKEKRHPVLAEPPYALAT